MRLLRCLPLLALFFAACSKTPGGVIPPKKMAALMADVYVADAVVAQERMQFADDSAKNRLKRDIFARHNTDEAAFDSSLGWYGHNLELYQQVNEEALAILRAREKGAREEGRVASMEGNGRTRELLEQGDSVDVWPLGLRGREFRAGLTSDRLVFTLRSNRNWEDGDIYQLRYKSRGTSRPVELSLAADYSDGSASFTYSESRSDGWHETVFALTPGKAPIVVYGYIAAPQTSGSEQFLARPVAVDSITLVRRRVNAPGLMRGVHNTVTAR